MAARISYPQRVRTFGIAGNRKNTVTVRTPWGIDVVKHRLIAGVYMDACNEAASTVRWRPLRIDSFAYRPIRNAVSLSLHSWALADDFFATPPGVPPPGGVWTPNNPVPADFARCFERRGFFWGARFSGRRDVPHIEWPGGAPSGPTIPVPVPEEDDMADPEVLKRLDAMVAVLSTIDARMGNVEDTVQRWGRKNGYDKTKPPIPEKSAALTALEQIEVNTR